MLDPSRFCPVCCSAYTLHVQDVIGRRTGNRFKQFFCMDCESFFNPSGYKEDDRRQQQDFEALSLQNENHRAIQSQLLLEIITRLAGVKTCLEVGHGNGWFLQACKDYGVQAHGFEVNPHCHNFVKSSLKLKCTLGLLDQKHKVNYDLIASIMVFEHIANPRQLFQMLTTRLNPDGAIYLCVPFAHRSEWKHLWTAGTTPGGAPPDIFYDNDVHITHFSVEGMKRMGVSLGARSADYFVSRDVYTHSPGAYHGVLFKF